MGCVSCDTGPDHHNPSLIFQTMEEVRAEMDRLITLEKRNDDNG
jgi:hypothetical protein